MASRRAYAAVAATALTVAVGAAAVPADAKAARPHVTGLSHHSEPTWGGDWIKVTGSGFHRTGRRAVAHVWFGSHKASHFYVVDKHTLQAQDPEVDGHRKTVHVVVVLRNGTRSPATRRNRFTFTVPTKHTPIHNGWSTVQSRRIGKKVIRRVGHTKAAPLAPRSGRWTPAMGQSAVDRAKRWHGMPYTWGGGNGHGPTYGSPYGNGLLGRFNATYRGFDCSGLALYAWAPYKGLPHYSAAQRSAGRFHPTLDELQPGDLLFFSGGGATVDHVVMYVGHGKIIQAPWSGHPVAVSTLAHTRVHEPRYFGATRPTSTGRQGAAPRITQLSVSTESPRGGGELTIRGSNLSTTSRIRFGATATYAFTIVSPTEVRVRIPAHRRGHVHIRLGNAWGVSPTTAADRFTYG